MNRLQVAWRVLRGHGVIYRCGLALNGPRLYVGTLTGHTVTVADNAIAPRLLTKGEIAVVDWEAGMVYPMYIDGHTP